MGVIILDSIQTPHGMIITNLYATFKGSCTVIKNADNTYVAKAMLYYYYDRNKKPIFCEEKIIPIEKNNLNENIIGLFYASLCAELVNYTTVLE